MHPWFHVKLDQKILKGLQPRLSITGAAIVLFSVLEKSGGNSTPDSDYILPRALLQSDFQLVLTLLQLGALDIKMGFYPNLQNILNLKIRADI